MPIDALQRRLPKTRESAERLGLVTRAALVRAVEAPPADGVRIMEAPAIRRHDHKN